MHECFIIESSPLFQISHRTIGPPGGTSGPFGDDAAAKSRGAPSRPSLSYIHLDPSDRYVILSTRGVYDNVPPFEQVFTCHRLASLGRPPGAAARRLAEDAGKRNLMLEKDGPIGAVVFYVNYRPPKEEAAAEVPGLVRTDTAAGRASAPVFGVVSSGPSKK